MNNPHTFFDRERLDVYRLAIEYVGFSFQQANRLPRANRVAKDQWLRAAQSIPLNIAEGNGKESMNDKCRFFEVARGSALECAAIHDVLSICSGLNGELTYCGKEKLRRIVSMLTRLIQRKLVSEAREEYLIATCERTAKQQSSVDYASHLGSHLTDASLGFIFRGQNRG